MSDFVATLKESTVALRIVRAVEDLLWRTAVIDFVWKGAEEDVVAKNNVKETKLAPASDPFATSVYTLPEHLRFQAALKKVKFGDDLLQTGDFEREGNLDAIGWQYIPFTTNNLEPSAMLVAGARRGRRALELSAKPPLVEGEEKPTPPPVVEHTRVAMVSPPVSVREGQVVRISGYIRIPKAMTGSVDGAMIWDSLGGEGLALRFHKAKDWTPFVLYRPVRQDGKVRVHLVATGAGSVQFDDLQIQTSDVPAPIAGRTLGESPRLR